jgi:Fe2+ or Zn2+ uptake regulation protein
VTEVADLGLGAAIEEIQHRTGWQVGSHRLELYGRCPTCRGAGPHLGASGALAPGPVAGR